MSRPLTSTSDTGQADRSSVTLDRLMTASPKDLFDCFTKAHLLKRWWVARGDADISCELSPHLGGNFRIVFTTRDGSHRVTTGEYVEVNPPSVLEFTWRWGESDSGARTSRVRKELESRGTQTRLRLCHSRLESKEECQQHTVGWTASLDYLQQQIDDQHLINAGEHE